MSARVLVVAHPRRKGAPETIAAAVEALRARGAEPVVGFDPDGPRLDAALVLGGDGTMLHAVELTRGTGVPLLGVNLGRVGFLAELEREELDRAVDAIAAGEYTIEERGTLDLTITDPDGHVEHGWALNEATVERAIPHRSLEVIVEVDGSPLSTFGCDGVVISTATGSTAHAFSAGGPVLWPNVDALLFVPLAAHALFAKPLVVGPESWFCVEVAGSSVTAGIVVLDGARTLGAKVGARIEVRRSAETVKLARVTDSTFTDRLVSKFHLPTRGWRDDLDEGREG